MLLLAVILAILVVRTQPHPVPVVAAAPVATDLASAARAAGYERAFIARLQSAQRPTVVMKPGRLGPMPAARGTSRIGGAPDLPAAARWPTCHGRPQTFLAQVRVRDLPPAARELRRAG